MHKLKSQDDPSQRNALSLHSTRERSVSSLQAHPTLHCRGLLYICIWLLMFLLEYKKSSCNKKIQWSRIKSKFNTYKWFSTEILSMKLFQALQHRCARARHRQHAKMNKRYLHLSSTHVQKSQHTSLPQSLRNHLMC